MWIWTKIADFSGFYAAAAAMAAQPGIWRSPMIIQVITQLSYFMGIHKNRSNKCLKMVPKCEFWRKSPILAVFAPPPPPWRRNRKFDFTLWKYRSKLNFFILWAYIDFSKIKDGTPPLAWNIRIRTDPLREKNLAYVRPWTTVPPLGIQYTR